VGNQVGECVVLVFIVGMYFLYLLTNSRVF